MARPIKKGLDYFPLDCHMDEKIDFIEAEFGLKGFAIVVKLFQRIYGGSEGYYCEWNKDISLLFARMNLSSGDGINLIDMVVASAIKRGIFSETIYKQYGVLTSAGIQKRYLEACNRRTKIDLIKQYLLIELDQNLVNGNINLVNVCNNSINSYNNTQSKVKESKLNYLKRDIDSNLSLLKKFKNKMEQALIDEAICIAKEKNANDISYVQGILRNWGKRNIFTLKEYRKQNITMSKAIDVKHYNKNQAPIDYAKYIENYVGDTG